MPIDPLSALSVAASVVQFVEFAHKIVSKGRQLYDSPNGALRDNEETETVTKRLQALAETLKESIEEIPRTKRAPTARAAKRLKDEYRQEVRLRQICAECDALSTELMQRLRDLKVPKGEEHRRWRSFRQALKSVWSKKGVDEMASKLDSLRKELDTQVLVLLRQQVSRISITQSARFLEFHEDLRELMKSLLQTRLAHSQDLQWRFEALTESQKMEHAKTRATFIQMEVDKNKRRVELGILESLKFPMMNDRYEKLAKAHEKTFLWIFRDPKDHDKPWDNFVNWLSSGIGTYWIQGKAASGKSTLFRFIWNNPETLRFLGYWSKGALLIVASFYFWNSGTPDQRSQSGLLRSLLYDVLKNRTEMIPAVFPEEWEKLSALATHDMEITTELWTLGQLLRAFEKLVSLAGPALKFCFFIDGLDEYDGDPEAISQFFQDVSSSTKHAKFCVSSRPWPVFLDLYEGIPGLKVQDLTKDDITLYVHDHLGKNKQMQRFLLMDAQNATWLVEEIVEKSAGVFLWVVLVVASLNKGLRSGDDIAHLRRRLDSLPTDLEELYGHMMKSIDPLDKEEASKIFQIFRTSGHSLDIPMLEKALRYDDYWKVIEMPTRTTPLSADEEERNNMVIESAVARLNSRSKGLLEVLYADRPVGHKQVPSGSLPISAIGKVWFNTWVACGPSIDPPGNTCPPKKCLVPRPPPPPSKDPVKIGLVSLPKIEEALESSIKTEDPLNSAAGGVQDSNNEYSTPSQSPTSSATHISKSTVPAPVPSPPYDNSLEGQSVSPPEPIRDPCEPYPSPPPTPFTGSGPTPTKPSISTEPPSDIQEAPAAVDSLEEDLSLDPDAGANFLQISYLHRTVRDYLEQQQVWGELLSNVKDSKFDPKTALLAAHVLEIKTTGSLPQTVDSRSRPSVYEGGIQTLTRVGKLAPLTSYDHIALLEEISTGIGIHWIGDASRTPELNYLGTDDAGPVPQRYQTYNGIIAAAMKSLLRRCIDGKLTDSPMSTRAPDVAFLAYALGVEFWVLGEPVQQLPEPDFKMVETLLGLGCNPNAVYKDERTLWEWILSYLHTLDNGKGTSKAPLKALKLWVRLTKLLLEHGADPSACCVASFHSWWLKLQVSRLRAAPAPVFGGYQSPPTVRKSNEKALRNLRVRATPFGNEKHHTVATVVKQVFMGMTPVPGARELLSVLSAKQIAARESTWSKAGKRNERLERPVRLRRRMLMTDGKHRLSVDNDGARNTKF